MSDALEQSGASAAPEVSATPTNPGDWLRQERERQGTTLQKIAADMHLSVDVIDAIERNRFSVFSAPVFAVGHLRKYASLLGLPVDRVLDLYRKLDDAPRQVDPVPTTQRAPEPSQRLGIREILNLDATGSESRRRALPWAIAVVVLIFAGGIAWWAFAKHSQKAPRVSEIPTSTEINSSAAPSAPLSAVARKVESQARREVPAQTAATSALPPSSSTSRQAPQQPQSQLPSQQPTESTAPSSRAALKPMGTPPPGKVRLRFSFTRESWIEVYDANGNRMLYDVGKTDLPRLLDVEPPAAVVLGDAEAVATEANGKVVQVPRKNISGTVAKFSIAADGSVR